jgi:DNA invertase Pin-like site-specific DNA recombinase
MRAAIYARYSTDNQERESIADQLRICTEYAERAGLQVAAEFTDAAISGPAIGNRPQLQAMLNGANAAEFAVILVTDLSRLSRSNGDLSKMIDRLVARGVRVVGVQDGYDSTRRGHKMQAGLSGIIGESFREMIADRTYAAIESRAKQGRSSGGKAYGYAPSVRADGSKWWHTLPYEADTVRWIYEQRAAGAGLGTIAHELNARGVPAPGAAWKRAVRRSDAKWLQSAVRNVLHNELYLGRVTWNRTRWIKDPDTGKRLQRERPASEWITTRDEALRIVSDVLWSRVRAMDNASRSGSTGQPKRGRPVRHLLSGLLRCELCGASMVIGGGQPLQYRCASRKDGGAHACANGNTVAKAVAEDLLIQPVRDLLLSDEAIAALVRDLRQIERERRERPARDEAADASAKSEARLDQLRGMRVEGLLTDEEFARLTARIAAERVPAKPSGTKQPNNIGAVVRALPAVAERLKAKLAARDALDDPRLVNESREALRELFGGTVKVRPSQDGTHLIARVGLTALPLVRAAGGQVSKMVAGARFPLTLPGLSPFPEAGRARNAFDKALPAPYFGDTFPQVDHSRRYGNERLGSMDADGPVPRQRGRNYLGPERHGHGRSRYDRNSRL